ncbi:MAG: hypothetical protein WBE20_12940 [Candidatus Acidiferrales bacterium]
METKPTHEQGKMQLEIFDLRREARLRQARDWFVKNFYAESFEEAMRIAPPMTDGGTNFMMVLTYWDMACSYLNHGLMHEDLFFESNGELFGVWERLKPSIAECRERFANPSFGANLQKAAESFEVWMEKRSPGHAARMREFMKQMRPQQTASAKA